MKVLLVNEHAPSREALCQMLTAVDYDVIPLEDGLQALKHLETERADLLVLDLRRPMRCAWQTVASITAEYPSLPVLIIGDPSASSDALAAGAAALIPDRFDDAELLQTLRVLLARPKQDGSHRMFNCIRIRPGRLYRESRQRSALPFRYCRLRQMRNASES